MRNISGKVVENTKTRFIFNIFFFENSAVCVTVWKNIIGPVKPQMTLWCVCVCIACWIPTATNLECVTIIVSPLQQWLHECASMLRYTYTACLLLYTSVPHHSGSQSRLYSISNPHIPPSLSFSFPLAAGCSCLTSIRYSYCGQVKRSHALSETPCFVTCKIRDL